MPSVGFKMYKLNCKNVAYSKVNKSNDNLWVELLLFVTSRLDITNLNNKTTT